jgi:hypothetical protein
MDSTHIMKGNGRTTLYYVIKDLQWVPRDPRASWAAMGNLSNIAMVNRYRDGKIRSDWIGPEI